MPGGRVAAQGDDFRGQINGRIENRDFQNGRWPPLDAFGRCCPTFAIALGKATDRGPRPQIHGGPDRLGFPSSAFTGAVPLNIR